MKKRLLTLFFLLIVLLKTNAFQHQKLTRQEWISDIDRLDEIIRTVHPNPFSRIGSSEWEERISDLKNQAGLVTDQEMSVNIASTVSAIKDGHTLIDFNDKLGFGRWYPIRFYLFEEGLYVTVTLPKNKKIIGGRVLLFQGLSPQEVIHKVSGVVSLENEFHGRNLAPIFLSNQTLLETFGIVKKDSPLNIKVELPSGELLDQEIESVESWYSPNYRFWGELFGPPIDQYESYVTPFEGGKNPLEYRKHSETAPPYYANRSPFWFRYDSINKTLLFQFNFAAELGDESFDQFLNRMLLSANKVEIEKFIIDARYNFGGNGNMMNSLVHTLIKLQVGQNDMRFYTLIGRQTFSAGIMLVSESIKHFNAILVGEPAGAGLNSFGDPRSYTLPHSELTLNVSSVYWQLGHPNNNDSYIKIHFPLLPKAADYFSGIDRAYNKVVNNELLFLSEILKGKSSAENTQIMQELRNKYSSFYWWYPFERNQDLLINQIDLLAKKNLNGAIQLVKLWFDLEPSEIQAVEKLAELYEMSNQNEEAKKCFATMLELDRFRTDVRKRIAELDKK